MSEIEELRDALDEAIKRNEALEAALDAIRVAFNDPTLPPFEKHDAIARALAESRP